MQLIHQRHARGPRRTCSWCAGVDAGSAGFAAIGAEQATPLRFNRPPDHPFGVRLAQRRDSGHGMEDVAHRAETHDEQTQVLWNLRQSPIFSRGLLQFARPLPPVHGQ